MSSGIQVLKQIPNSTDSLYLTFDDGPDALGTPAVLELLKKLQCHATFFLIAEKAKAHPDLVQTILDEGHSIGNHSLDHRYRAFFASSSQMQSWIEDSTAIFKGMGIFPVGFRPPAGVRTPKLHQALGRLKVPLILWNKRFFDTTLPFTAARALRSLEQTNPGSIILLHDRQRPARLLPFLKTLEIYLRAGQSKGLQFRALTEDVCKPKVAEF